MAEVVRLLEHQTITATFTILKSQKILPLTTETDRPILKKPRAFDRWVRRHHLLPEG
jgi:hypothetical protein